MNTRDQFDIQDVERLRYFAACLAHRPPTAAFDRIRDSQTRSLLDRIRRHPGGVRIVDIGCGQLRLLYALLSVLKEETWTYYGVDVSDPRATHPNAYDACVDLELPGQRWSVGTIDELRSKFADADLCVICNVLHEISIADTAEIIEHSRRILTPDGVLLVMDMGFVPEGEPRFVPLTDSDLDILLPQHKKHSFISRTGVPIIVAEANRGDIPPYFLRRAMLREWMAYKRDAFAFLGLGLRTPRSRTILSELKLTGDATFDFLYLNTVVANATYRVVEEDTEAPKSVSKDDYSIAGRAILSVIEREMVSDKPLTLTTATLFDELGALHRFEAIDAALEMLGRIEIPSVLQHVPLVFHGHLEPSEFFDYIIDRPEKHGLFGDRYLTDVLVRYGSDWIDDRS